MTRSLYSPVVPACTGEDPTPDELVARAADLRPRLRKLQTEHERLGGYTEEIHQEFLDAGFYRILQPRKYGGFEYGLDDFVRVGIEISRGDPGVGWSFILGAGHSFHVASFFGEQAQEELFGDGTFIAPGRTIPSGKAVEEDGGYRLTGKWDYCSGSMWSTHVLVVAPSYTSSGEASGLKMFAVPRKDYTILDDWGGDRTIGLRASSSNSVQIEDAVVPSHLAIHYDFREHSLGSKGTLGYQLHKNPMYLGRSMTFFNAELVATQVGAAWAAMDEFEQLMEVRPSSFPPRMPRLESPEYHRWFGQLLALTDSAETLLLAGVRQYVELGRRWEATGEEFTPEQDGRLRAVVQQAARLANDAVELAFTTAGTSSAKSGSPMEKYYRDVAMYKTHIAAQWDVTFGSLSRFHFGQPLTF
ncbi:acyl-CoA dehydrogenase family protein [Arthrobacter sp. CAL618]|uniref:acyl-CoA dehydrogenase family protein n=1 Tax=Arthrobacter sp. CAL618 TaxID=1055770 RepID=UPI0004102116|nr:acyl-CoA dehydrogenase family protein [Arthrobacter sp. CAL618]